MKPLKAVPDIPGDFIELPPGQDIYRFRKIIILFHFLKYTIDIVYHIRQTFIFINIMLIEGFKKMFEPGNFMLNNGYIFPKNVFGYTALLFFGDGIPE